MQKESPFIHYQNKLCVKVRFLTSDRKPHADSLHLITYRAFKKRMDSGTCTEKQMRKGSFGGGSLVLYKSLSREYKDALTTQFGDPKEEIKKSWFADHYVADRDAFNFYVAHRYGENQEKKLDLEKIEEYTYNSSVLNTVVKMKSNRKEYAKAHGFTKVDIWQSLSNDVNAFREVPHTLPPSKDGLRRKATAYSKALFFSKSEAYKTVISGKLQTANAKKVVDKKQMAMLDELLSKHTNLDNEFIASVYNTIADQLGWERITAMTVSNRKTKKSLVVTAGRKGVSELRNNKLMQNKRKRPSSPMLYWTLDGWDVELMYQKTDTNKKNHSVTSYHNRLTVVVVLDPHNNYPIGYAIGTHETPDLIKQALQNAMQHARELFGEFYMPYQVQSDRYAIKKLTPLYQAITPHFTPAQARNGKSKVIEPYFNSINKKYCKLLNNWSGHNVDSGSKNQPNAEYLNKIKKQFPDQKGCEKQIVSIMNTERSKKGKEYANNWLNTKEEHKQIMNYENYLLTFGSSTGDTNKLRGEGLVIKIHGQERTYDSFDVNFRHNAHLDWSIQYDLNDLSQVLAVSSNGKERFILEQKYIQPMALADRIDGDTDQLKRVKDFNKTIELEIVNERSQNAELLDPFLRNPELDNTLAKLLLTDSIGQHKNPKSKQRLKPQEKAKKLNQRNAKKEEKQTARTFMDEQNDYYNQKVNVNEYLED